MNAPERAARFWQGLRPRAAVGAIGLDFGTRRLHLVQLARTPQGPAMRAAVSLPYGMEREAALADARRLRALLTEARRHAPFRGRLVVTRPPPADTRILALAYRVGEGQDPAAALLRELRERVREPLEDWVVDYLPVRPEAPEAAERNAVVAMARRPAVIAYLDALNAAGLEVAALDIGPAALARLFALPRPGGDYDNTLLVNCGRERSFLTVIWGRRLMLDREVEFGESRLARRLAAGLGLDETTALALLGEHGFFVAHREGAGDADEIPLTVTEILRAEFVALAAEIDKTLIYTASRTRGSSVSRVCLHGSVARHPGAARLVESLISVPVEVFDPLAHFPPPAGFAHAEPAALALATGLALRGLGEHEPD